MNITFFYRISFFIPWELFDMEKKLLFIIFEYLSLKLKLG